MADLGNFNANDHDDMADFSMLPQGWYLVTITDDEVKISEASGNRYLKLEFTVADSDMKGRKQWNNLNLWHPKQEVQGYAQREMATICRAVNVLNPSDSAQLRNIPLGIKIGHKKNKQSGEMDAVIRAYCSEKEFADKASSNPAPTAPNTEGGNSAPWTQ